MSDSVRYSLRTRAVPVKNVIIKKPKDGGHVNRIVNRAYDRKVDITKVKILIDF